MLKKLIPFLLAITSCFACGQPALSTPKPAPPAHVILHGDTDFTPEERSDLLEATNIWRMQTGNLAQVTIVFDLNFNDDEVLKLLKRESKLVRADSTMKAVQDIDCEAAEAMGLPCGTIFTPQVLAWVEPSGGIHNFFGINPNMIVVIDRLADRKYMVQVIVHELGHILGLPHINDDTAIMYPSAYPKEGPVCLTEKDLAGYCMANGCGNVKMSPCEGEKP